MCINIVMALGRVVERPRRLWLAPQQFMTPSSPIDRGQCWQMLLSPIYYMEKESYTDIERRRSG